MKKVIAVIILIFCLFIPSVNGQGIKAYFNYHVFLVPDKGPYVETELSVFGNTLKYVLNENKKYQGSVEVSVIFKQHDEIKAANKYNLYSPEISDTTAAKPNFIDIQRFSLPNGKYDMELSIKDKNKQDSAFRHTQPVSINFSSDSIVISDIQLLESFTKNENPGMLTKSGYDLVPYVSNFYPENFNKLIFYTEVYNTKKAMGMDEKFLINYSIESYETNSQMSDYMRYSKQVSSEANVLLASLDITSLPSGNYYLKIEVKDKINTPLCNKKLFFQRSSSSVNFKLEDINAVNIKNTFVERIGTLDSLKEYIRSVRPISSESEKLFAENQLKTKDITQMRQYLYSYWSKRDLKDPELAFINYNKQVARVNKIFSTQTRRGHETERGRVYLQYGPPDSRTEVTNEPNSYPYEIWHYVKVKGQGNRKFVFYNTDLVSNNYQLLFSDVIGETSDQNWQMTLRKRSTHSTNLDQQKGGKTFGGNADDYFTNPR